MDVRLGRFRIVNEQESSYLPASAQLPSVIDCNDGRFSIIVDKDSQNASLPSVMDCRFGRFSIIVDKESRNAKSPNVMDCRFGRSRITNELQQKLYDFLPILPI